jgi:serine protease AprX
VITVGGYDDKNDLDPTTIDLYHSNFGPTADGFVKPELIAPAMWVAAPILPRTPLYERAETLSRLLAAPDYELSQLAQELAGQAEIPRSVLRTKPGIIRAFLESVLSEQKIIAAHYQHVDGTSFAAPIVASLVAQMLEANPALSPIMVRKILISTADRIAHAPVLRQGYGVIDARQAVSLAADKTLRFETLNCAPPRIENGKVLFAFQGVQAVSVSLAGDFNGWDSSRTKLDKDEHGFWRTALDAPPPGTYQYKFIINGEWWLEDPNNGVKAPDGHGGLNSVLTIK